MPSFERTKPFAQMPPEQPQNNIPPVIKNAYTDAHILDPDHPAQSEDPPYDEELSELYTRALDVPEQHGVISAREAFSAFKEYSYPQNEAEQVVLDIAYAEGLTRLHKTILKESSIRVERSEVDNLLDTNPAIENSLASKGEEGYFQVIRRVSTKPTEKKQNK